MKVISSYLILKPQGRIHDDVPHEAHNVIPAFDTAGLLWCAWESFPNYSFTSCSAYMGIIYFYGTVHDVFRLFIDHTMTWQRIQKIDGFPLCPYNQQDPMTAAQN